MPVPEHGQMPLFSDDDPIRELLELAKTQARIIDRLTGTRDGTIGSLRAYKPPSEPRPKRRYQPQNRSLRDWKTFREYYQELERIVRKGPPRLEQTDPVTREMLYGAGGPHPRTQARGMKGYGLESHHWPPSTWPEDAPSDK